MRLGFIGLGKLGRPMALRLLRAGHPLVVHNRSREVVDVFAQLGATPAWSPREVAEQSDIVFTALVLPSTVESVYLGDDGLIAAARADLICIDHSTIGPQSSRRIAGAMVTRGVDVLDAPVSGGPKAADDGALAIMVGGSRRAFERVQPLLASLGRHVQYCGPSGAGATVKLVNQVLVFVNSVAVAEALVFAERLGVEPALIVDLLKGGLGASAMLARNGPRVVDENYAPGAKVELVVKDAGLIRELCDSLQLELPVFFRAKQTFEAAFDQRLGSEDLAAVVKVVREAQHARSGHVQPELLTGTGHLG